MTKVLKLQAGTGFLKGWIVFGNMLSVLGNVAIYLCLRAPMQEGFVLM